jgi:hypothetical protein
METKTIEEIVNETRHFIDEKHKLFNEIKAQNSKFKEYLLLYEQKQILDIKKNTLIDLKIDEINKQNTSKYIKRLEIILSKTDKINEQISEIKLGLEEDNNKLKEINESLPYFLNKKNQEIIRYIAAQINQITKTFVETIQQSLETYVKMPLFNKEEHYCPENIALANHLVTMRQYVDNFTTSLTVEQLKQQIIPPQHVAHVEKQLYTHPLNIDGYKQQINPLEIFTEVIAKMLVTNYKNNYVAQFSGNTMNSHRGKPDALNNILQKEIDRMKTTVTENLDELRENLNAQYLRKHEVTSIFDLPEEIYLKARRTTTFLDSAHVGSALRTHGDVPEFELANNALKY